MARTPNKPVTVERATELWDKYDESVFQRNPHYAGGGAVGSMHDEEGERLVFTDDNGEDYDPIGLLVNVTYTDTADQSVLPPGQRIPDCLEGVPVWVRLVFIR